VYDELHVVNVDARQFLDPGHGDHLVKFPQDAYIHVEPLVDFYTCL